MAARSGRPHPRTPGDQPAHRADRADGQHAEHILHPGATARLALLDDLGQRVLDLAGAPVVAIPQRRGRATSRPRQGIVAIRLPSEQRGGGVGGLGRGRGAPPATTTTSVAEIVIDALADEDAVREAEVDGDGDDDGDEPGPGGPDQIGQVAEEPDGQEGEGDGLSAAVAVVLDDLGDLHEAYEYDPLPRLCDFSHPLNRAVHMEA